MTDIDSFREELQSLISKFEKDRNYYLSKGYLEAQVRLDFLNPFFNALGWDIENKGQKPPHDRDVIVELSPETTKRTSLFSSPCPSLLFFNRHYVTLFH